MPEPTPITSPYLRAFVTLCETRTSSANGPNPIATVEVIALLDIYGVDDFDERGFFFEIIRTLDNYWLGKVREKQNAK